MLLKIESTDNKIVKKAVKLNSSKACRREEKMFVTEGLRLCRDASEYTAVENVFFTCDFSEKHPQELKEISDKAVGDIFEISENVAKKLAETQHPQGIFCLCRMNNLSAERLKKSKYLALENISDPSNLGTIIRTAEAFNLDGLILSPDCCDLYNPKVIRGSMGGAFRLNIIETDDFTGFLNESRKDGFKIIATTPDRNAEDIKSLNLQKKIICLIGNEGNGLTEEAFGLSDEMVTIPMSGRGESLNASVAASIIIYEITR